MPNPQPDETELTQQDKPSDPAAVNQNTPLADLNLNWGEADLPERVRTKHVHRLHPYLGKFIPQLAEVFLRKYFAAGQTVLDPFAGSGTTLVQANELGINAVGYDISAFNVLLCEAKTTQYDLVQVRIEVNDVLEKVRKATQYALSDLPLFQHAAPQSTTPATDNPYLLKWFAPQALAELLAYRDLIERGDYRYQALLKIILSRAARSARLTTHFDLDFPKKPQTESYWCYKHNRMCSPTTEAFKFIQRYSLDALKRVEEFSRLRQTAQVRVFNFDSRSAPTVEIEGVVTSPPYVGLIDYHEQHHYAYQLLGLQDQRDAEIGPAAKGTSQKSQRQYQQDIAAVFRRALEGMPVGGRLVIVAADRAGLYPGIANLLNVEVEDVLERHVNRRTGRRSTEFFESIFIWRKMQLR